MKRFRSNFEAKKWNALTDDLLRKVEICIEAGQRRLLEPEDLIDEKHGYFKKDTCSHILRKDEWPILSTDEVTYEQIGNCDHPF